MVEISTSKKGVQQIEEMEKWYHNSELTDQQKAQIMFTVLRVKHHTRWERSIPYCIASGYAEELHMNLEMLWGIVETDTYVEACEFLRKHSNGKGG